MSESERIRSQVDYLLFKLGDIAERMETASSKNAENKIQVESSPKYAEALKRLEGKAEQTQQMLTRMQLQIGNLGEEVKRWRAAL